MNSRFRDDSQSYSACLPTHNTGGRLMTNELFKNSNANLAQATSNTPLYTHYKCCTLATLVYTLATPLHASHSLRASRIMFDSTSSSRTCLSEILAKQLTHTYYTKQWVKSVTMYKKIGYSIPHQFHSDSAHNYPIQQKRKKKR